MFTSIAWKAGASFRVCAGMMRGASDDMAARQSRTPPRCLSRNGLPPQWPGDLWAAAPTQSSSRELEIWLLLPTTCGQSGFHPLPANGRSGFQPLLFYPCPRFYEGQTSFLQSGMDAAVFPCCRSTLEVFPSSEGATPQISNRPPR